MLPKPFNFPRPAKQAGLGQSNHFCALPLCHFAALPKMIPSHEDFSTWINPSIYRHSCRANHFCSLYLMSHS